MASDLAKPDAVHAGCPGREQHEPGPELWREHTDQVTQLRDQLSAVDPTDRATGARVACETSGAFAAWSPRVEATPGPLPTPLPTRPQVPTTPTEGRAER